MGYLIYKISIFSPKLILCVRIVIKTLLSTQETHRRQQQKLIRRP